MAKESRKMPLSDASTLVRRARARARVRVRVRARARPKIRARVKVWARVRAATEHIDARPAGWLELL